MATALFRKQETNPLTWSITDDPEVFRSEAGSFLAARPDLHTMLLSGLETIEQLRSGGRNPPTVLGWWREPEEAATTAAFVWTPPHLLAASRLSRVAATRLAEFLSIQAHPFTQLLAGSASVGAFCEAWRTTTGSAPKNGPHLRLHRLERLVRPDGSATGAAGARQREPARTRYETPSGRPGPWLSDRGNTHDERVRRSR
ncbi:hypothetical protein AB0C14_07765 [Microbispora hainanensis]|uniref:hypothetical protein n=1 Tax=Microbispora hainanensis TaxID=568844 RepID=UPI0033F928F1